MLNRLLAKVIDLVAEYLTRQRRRYDIKLGKKDENPVFIARYYLLFKKPPKWFPFNIVLNNICSSDAHELHDHPWNWASLVLRGGYWEETLEGRYWRGAGSLRIRKAEVAHRIELDKEKAQDSTWTLFIFGKTRREWGYVTDFGWIHGEERDAEPKLHVT